MKATINRCPYCNSMDIAIDVNVTIGCHLEDGMIVLDDGYFDGSARQLDDNLKEADLDDMKGFCHHCGSYFDVERIDEKGFQFRPENVAVQERKEKNNAL
jgi:hypothetical protein